MLLQERERINASLSVYESVSGGVRACLRCDFFFFFGIYLFLLYVHEDTRVTSNQGGGKERGGRKIEKLLCVSIDIASFS